MPLAVWTGGQLETESGNVPVIIVIGDWDQASIMRFVRRCEGSYGEATRLHRLMKCHNWIYHDLFSTFMDWNEIWDVIRDRLSELHHEVHHQFGTGNILGRMQGLNKATATNIMLRETVKVQNNSLETVMEMVKKEPRISWHYTRYRIHEEGKRAIEGLRALLGSRGWKQKSSCRTWFP